MTKDLIVDCANCGGYAEFPWPRFFRKPLQLCFGCFHAKYTGNSLAYKVRRQARLK